MLFREAVFGNFAATARRFAREKEEDVVRTLWSVKRYSSMKKERISTDFGYKVDALVRTEIGVVC
jgi:hypothetical protein